MTEKEAINELELMKFALNMAIESLQGNMIVHAHWKNHRDYKGEETGYYLCTNCYKIAIENGAFCPNCGSIMDGMEE